MSRFWNAPRRDTAPLRRGLVFLVLIAGLPMAGAAAASAHPFGPPLTAKVSAEGSTVTVAWAAAEDDWLRLGEHVGAFDEPTTPGESPVLTGAEKLQRSESLRAYLLDNVSVDQGDGKCAGAVTSLEDPLGTGVELSFDCAAPVDEVDVTLSVLSDVNAAYRTFATASEGTSPRRALLSSSSPTTHFSFAAGTAASGPPYLVILGLLLAAALGVVVAAARATHLRRNRAQ